MANLESQFGRGFEVGDKSMQSRMERVPERVVRARASIVYGGLDFINRASGYSTGYLFSEMI